MPSYLEENALHEIDWEADEKDAFDPVPVESVTSGTSGTLLDRHVFNGGWLEDQEFPPLKWAVPGLIPEGFGFLTAPPKVGKSWLSLDIALRLAAGERLLGGIDGCAARPVLLLALEDSPRRLQKRARQLLGYVPDNLDMATQVATPEVVPLIREWMQLHNGKDPLVILDTLGKVMPDKKPGENEYHRDYRIGSALKGLADDNPGSTVMAIHHTRKMAAEDWMDSTSGTNGLNGAADWTLNLYRERQSKEALLRVTGRDVTEHSYALLNVGVDCVKWVLDGGSLEEAAQKAGDRIEAAISKTNLGDGAAEVLDFVRNSPEPVGPAEVDKALGRDDSRKVLGRLVEGGRLVRPSRGKYAFPKGGVTSGTSVTSGEQAGVEYDDKMESLLAVG